jgi:hypothetical protein
MAFLWKGRVLSPRPVFVEAMEELQDKEDAERFKALLRLNYDGCDAALHYLAHTDVDLTHRPRVLALLDLPSHVGRLEPPDCAILRLINEVPRRVRTRNKSGSPASAGRLPRAR